MKVLHITPSYKPAYIYGGTIESVARLCEGLVQAGVEVTVFTTTANGKKELDAVPGIEYVIDGVKVFYFKRQTKDHSHISLLLWKRLRNECKKYDVVHIHSWWNILVLVAAWICKKQKVKTIISPRGMLSDYIFKNSKNKLKNFIHSNFGKSLLKYSTFHATSKAEFAECKKLISGWKGFVLPNIIWLPELKIKKKENKVFTVAFLSRIHQKKGIELLMQAISKSSLNIYLQIAGTGDDIYINQLKQKAKDLGLEEKINWLGWKDRQEKFDVFMNADLFALTSYNENFANVVIESLYAGTPVLLSNKVGLSDFVAEQDLGWICNLNIDDVKINLESAYYNIDKRLQITSKSQLIINEHFAVKNLIAFYIKEYRKIINDNATNKKQQFIYN